MHWRARIGLLVAVLGLAGLWIAHDAAQRPPRAKAPHDAVRSASDKGAGAEGGPRAPALPERQNLAQMRRDPFAPPPRPASVAPPPPPVVHPAAAPFPFRFAGRWRTASGTQFFLARGDEVLTAVEGEMLGEEHRVQSIGVEGIVLLHVTSGMLHVVQLQPEESEGAPRLADAEAPERAEGRGPAVLRWEGPPRATAGAEFEVRLYLTTVQQVRSVPMRLLFDPAALQAVMVRPGFYFASAAASFNYRVSPQGAISVTASSGEEAPAAEVELLVMTFRPTRPGAAEIRLAGLGLQGPGGGTIPYRSLAAFRTEIAP